MQGKWPTRRKWLTLPAVVLVLGCLTWLLLPAPAKGVRAAYNRIEIGMDFMAVTAFMWNNPDFPQLAAWTDSNGDPVRVFYSPGGTITLTLNHKGQVATKTIDDSWLARVGYYLDRFFYHLCGCDITRRSDVATNYA